jgi:hypothetical protein
MSRNAWIVTVVAVILVAWLVFGIVGAANSMRDMFDEETEAIGLATHALGI